VTATDAIRWLHHEAARCHGRGAADAFCLTLPPILCALELEPMTREQAAAFSRALSEALQSRATNPRPITSDEAYRLEVAAL
jgi:hypothetical protein